MYKTEIEVKKLTPALCEDWLGFFDGIAFGDHGEWAFCYCLEGHMTRKDNEDLKDHNMRRNYAKQLILEGKMQGYLAYDGDKVVGWCNVNDRNNYPYVTELFTAMGHEAENVKTKSIFCFLVASEYRGRGIATRFLEQVCKDAKQEGYEQVEAYPFKDENMEFQFHGTIKMYRNNGFEQNADLQFIKVMSIRL